MPHIFLLCHINKRYRCLLSSGRRLAPCVRWNVTLNSFKFIGRFPCSNSTATTTHHFVDTPMAWDCAVFVWCVELIGSTTRYCLHAASRISKSNENSWNCISDKWRKIKSGLEIAFGLNMAEKRNSVAPHGIGYVAQQTNTIGTANEPLM